MKKISLFASAFVLAFTLVSCGGSNAPEATETSAEPAVEMEFQGTPITVNVDLEQSKVLWSGSVLGMHSHNGSVNLSQGQMTMEGDQITGGSFTVDMTSIHPMDDGYSEDKTPEMLVGHLSSGDFFLVDSFPTAQFVIKSADMSAHTITGDLTVRGTTKEEVIENVMINPETVEASGTLTFNRQDYGVAFTHPMKDVVISDDIELEIKLKQ